MVRTRSTSNKSVRREEPGIRARARRSKSDSGTPRKRPSNSEGPKILGTPIKSPADENDYRIIELSNGLRAILISCIPCVNKPQKIERNRKCLDKAIVEFNANIVGVEVRNRPQEARPTSSSTSCERRRSSVGRSKPCRKTHSKDCDCDVSPIGVAVSIATGNFHGPEDYPGLAHLMEHLIFCGETEKYPERTCQKFIRENRARYINAETQGGDVSYYFGIDYQDLRIVLDTFAQAFVSPALHLKDISTEREAVDSEYLDNKHSDPLGILRMYQVFMKQSHPAATFHVGSKETLVTPDGNDETLRKILLEYLDQEYGAGNITVALHGPEPLDVLQKLVVDHFEQIPKRTVKVPLPPPEGLASDPAKFRRLYRLKPHSDMNKLLIAWDIPIRMILNYETKPLVYIATLLNTEAPGGLVAYLKQRKWISSLCCNVADADDNDFSSGLLSVDCILRNTEPETVFQILNALHSYLKFLTGISPQEWYFNELRWIRSLKFHFFGEHDDPAHNAPIQARNLRNYQPEDCLIGGHLITKWDPPTISACLELLTPENANVMFISKYAENCKLVEPFYDVRYGVMDDEPYQCWVKQWMKVKPLNEFKFHCPKKFITTQFCGIEPKCTGDPRCKSEVEKRIVVVDNNKMNFCNKKNKTETANYEIRVETAVPLHSTENTVLLRIWLELFRRTLRPLLYGVKEALMEYTVGTSKKGIICNVSGFGQHLHLIVLEIFKQIENLHPSLTPEMFEDAKNDGLECIRNLILEPEKLAMLLQQNICYKNMNLSWPAKYNVLTAVTFDDLHKFSVDFKNRLYIKIIGSGDVDQETSLNLASSILETLSFEPFPKPSIGFNPPMITAYELPLGDSILRVRSKNTRSNKSISSCLYQVPAEPDAHEISKILVALMNFPALIEFRRKQNLGYNAGVLYKEVASRPNIIVFIDSHSNKFSGTHVKNTMDNFVRQFFDSRIKELTQAEVKAHTDTNIKVEQVMEYYETYLLPGASSEMRKLTIQIVGNADQEFSQESIQDISVPVGRTKPTPIRETDMSVTVLTPSPTEEKSKCASPHRQQFIRNIMDFKSKLFTYPTLDPDSDHEPDPED